MQIPSPWSWLIVTVEHLSLDTQWVVHGQLRLYKRATESPLDSLALIDRNMSGVGIGPSPENAAERALMQAAAFAGLSLEEPP